MYPSDLSRPALRQRMAAAGRARAERQFSAERQGREFAELYAFAQAQGVIGA